MKKVYLLLGLVLLSLGLVAQSFELTNSETETIIKNNDTVFVNGTSDMDHLGVHLKLKNKTANVLLVKAFFEGFDLPEDIASFCFGSCFAPGQDSSGIVEIKANSYLSGVVGVDLYPGGQSGVFIIKMTYKNEADAEDFISFFVKFNVKSVGIAAKDVNFRIYPNPIVDVLNVAVESSLSNSNVELYDALGKMIMSQKLSSFETRIDLSDLRNGLYFIKLKDGYKVLETRKIIKR